MSPAWEVKNTLTCVSHLTATHRALGSTAKETKNGSECAEVPSASSRVRRSRDGSPGGARWSCLTGANRLVASSNLTMDSLPESERIPSRSAPAVPPSFAAAHGMTFRSTRVPCRGCWCASRMRSVPSPGLGARTRSWSWSDLPSTTSSTSGARNLPQTACVTDAELTTWSTTKHERCSRPSPRIVSSEFPKSSSSPSAASIEWL